MDILLVLAIIGGISVAWAIKAKKAEKARMKRDMEMTPVTSDEIAVADSLAQGEKVEQNDARVVADAEKNGSRPVKTFGQAPGLVKTVSVLLILDAVVGVVLNPMSAGGLVVRFFIVRGIARGSAGARGFLLFIGAFALLVGIMMLYCTPAGEKNPMGIALLYGGAFNLLMGMLLCGGSAREWFR